jgi:beta-N-acetylhexosaminidase
MVLLCNQSIGGGTGLDEFLDGMEAAHAQGLWARDDDSEARRLSLLPQSAPLAWDELMHHAPYQHALELLP